jgi:hypothetical protein
MKRAERTKWFRLPGRRGRRFIVGYDGNGKVQVVYERLLEGEGYLTYWTNKLLWHGNQQRPQEGLVAELLALAERERGK